jgi:hypothetical protein
VAEVGRSSLTLVEVPLDLVDFDARRARRDTDSYIYSDLLFFLGLGDSRPGGVTGQLTGGRVVVVSRSRYAAIAQDLGLGKIECLFPADTPQAELAEFLERPGVRLITGWQEKVHEIPEPGIEWHVVAFDRPLTDEELDRFTESVREVFAEPERPGIEVFRAEADPTVVYFQAWTRHDRDQTIDLFATLQRFDHDTAPIRSYRGGRFKHQLRP